MSAFPHPRVLCTEQSIQLSYEVPNRINTAIAYPIQSPNGSKIILYGTNNGVRILWRGGRPFKTAGSAKNSQETSNGAASGTVMLIDSDDEVSTTVPAFVDEPEFEEDEEEIDLKAPYSPIVQYLDLMFGVSVLQLTIPPRSMAEAPETGGLTIAKEKIVFAAACGDNTIRVITLPMTPPSPQSKSRKDLHDSITASQAGQGKWGETVTTLAGHPIAANTLSMTFASTHKTSKQNTQSTNSGSRSKVQDSADGWHILVASHSNAVQGLLLLHKVPIITRQQGKRPSQLVSSSTVAPFQTRYLSSPAITISFNSSVLSYARSTRLLVADKGGACKIYDCQVFADIESLHSAETERGVWLLTLYPGFQNSKGDNNATLNASSLSGYGRKTIVDAQWVFDGKAVMALLMDGEWGIWDIEGARSNGTSGVMGQNGLRGGATTKFTLSGWIDNAPLKSASRGFGQQGPARFAPMTPGTRRNIETTLFIGRTGNGIAHGQISVARLHSPTATSAIDESVAIWLEDSYVVIPHLSLFWDSQRKGNGGTLFGTKTGNRLIRLESINIYGEKCCGIDQMVQSRQSTKAGFPTDILILGEHRFLLVADNTSEQEMARAAIAPRLPRSQALVTTSDDSGLADIDMALDLMDTDTPVRVRKTLRFA